MGGTPLHECVVAAHTLVNQFRQANPIQKMNVIFLTDGDGGQMAIHRTEQGENMLDDGSFYYDARRFKGVLNGREVAFYYAKHTVYETLIQHLRQTTGATVIGFFVPSSVRTALKYADHALDYRNGSYTSNSNFSKSRDAKSQYQKDGCLIIKDGYGFDEYYILAAGDDLEIDTDDGFDTDFEVVDVKKVQGKLARAFTEFNSSKRTQRIILSKFSQAIA
jgi:hypothetical protein